MTRSSRISLPAGLVLAFCVATFSPPASAEIFVQVEPETTLVDPSEQFSVDLFVPVAGDEFDAYETIITWDQSLLQFVDVDEASLMGDACGFNWFQWEDTDSSLFLSHAFLCGGGLTVTGPGPLSTLTFTALLEGTSEIAFEYIDFFKGGILNQNVTSQDGVATIGTQSSAPEGGGRFDLRMPALEVFPNPGAGSVTIELRAPDDLRSASLSLFDARGRRIDDVLRGRAVASGTHRIRWSPGDATFQLASGVYFWRLDSGAGEIAVRKMIVGR